MSNFPRSETTPQQSQQLLSAMFEQTAVGFAYLSLDGQWLQVNRKLAEMVGCTPEELLTHSLQEITHPEERDIDRELMQKLQCGEIPNYAIEKRYLHKEGYQIWVNLTVSLVQQPSGKFPILLLVMEEISDRKQLEDVIKALVKGKSKAVAVFEVFDADEREVKQSKLATKVVFEEGLFLYYQQAFSEALRCFEVVFSINSRDKVAQIYLERCQQQIRKIAIAPG